MKAMFETLWGDLQLCCGTVIVYRNITNAAGIDVWALAYGLLAMALGIGFICHAAHRPAKSGLEVPKTLRR